jgi:hypothetical protein
MDGDDPRAILPGNLRGAIRRPVVDDDHLVGDADGTRRRANRVQRRGEERFFVIGRNDDRDHGEDLVQRGRQVRGVLAA